MAGETKMELCYNRGCGQSFDPAKNSKESCRHHPGAPFFHDAYKGWSCCNKKCTDFTEFLNIKGCTISFHSNIKPPEPEKQQLDEDLLKDAEPKLKPIVASTLQRPSFDSELTTKTPIIASSLKAVAESQTSVTKTSTGEIEIGTSCKNKGCSESYQGPGSNLDTCVHHPGVPIFHEGLKFWSCCKKRTSDFNDFLNQVGCASGKHVWIADSQSTEVKCRWDWHQTGANVIVTVYAKKYCPNKSVVKLNPIRLYIKLVFPEESNAEFNLDAELRGIVDVEESKVQMFGTKVEITLKKAEPGSWAKLDWPRDTNKPKEVKKEENKKVEDITPDMEAVDLSGL